MKHNEEEQFYNLSLKFLSILKQMSINKDPVDPENLKEYLMNDALFCSFCAPTPSQSSSKNIKTVLMKQIKIFQKYLNAERYESITKSLSTINDSNSAEVIASVIAIIAKSYFEYHQSFSKIDTFFREILSKITSSNKNMLSMMNDNLKALDSDTEKDVKVLEDVKDINSILDSESDYEEVKKRITDFTDNMSKIIEEKVSLKQESSAQMKAQISEIQKELETHKSKTEEMQKELVRYKEEAITDELTGLFRKNYMYRKFSEMIDFHSRHNATFPIIMTDLDKFKRINDTYGHAQGDQVLKHFAAIIKKHLRNTDTPFRYGGEEFLILLEHGSDVNAACLLANRILKEMNEVIFRLKGDKVKITASFGIAEYQNGDSMDDAIEKADQNLYKAKNNGRNQIFCNGEQFEE